MRSSINFLSPLKIWSLDNKEYTNLDYDNLSELENLGIKSEVRVGDTKILPNEISGFLTRNYEIPLLSDSDEIYLDLECEDSRYDCYSVKVWLNPDNSIDCEKSSNNNFKSSYKIFPLGENDELSSREISIEMITRRIEVSVISSDSIDVSSMGNYINYGGSFSFKFMPVSSNFSKITWQFDGDNNINELSNPGEHQFNEVKALLSDDKGIYTFSLDNIRKNCIIKIVEAII